MANNSPSVASCAATRCHQIISTTLDSIIECVYIFHRLKYNFFSNLRTWSKTYAVAVILPWGRLRVLPLSDFSKPKSLIWLPMKPFMLFFPSLAPFLSLADAVDGAPAGYQSQHCAVYGHCRSCHQRAFPLNSRTMLRRFLD